MLTYCAAPSCMKRAVLRRTMQDPRRNNEPTTFFVCSDECEWNLIQWLDATAEKMQLVKEVS